VFVVNGCRGTEDDKTAPSQALLATAAKYPVRWRLDNREFELRRMFQKSADAFRRAPTWRQTAVNLSRKLILTRNSVDRGNRRGKSQAGGGTRRDDGRYIDSAHGGVTFSGRARRCPGQLDGVIARWAAKRFS